jgi:hypothetical protein
VNGFSKVLEKAFKKKNDINKKSKWFDPKIFPDDKKSSDENKFSCISEEKQNLRLKNLIQPDHFPKVVNRYSQQSRQSHQQ